jgi:hypothetical protein
MLLLLVEMPWQRLFMLGCLIGMPIVTVQRIISLYFFHSCHNLNLFGFDVSLGLLRRLIGLSGRIQLPWYKLEYWTFMALNASNIIGNIS